MRSGQEEEFQGIIHCSKIPLLMDSNLHFDYCLSVSLVPGSRPSELDFNIGNQVGDPDVSQIAKGTRM